MALSLHSPVLQLDPDLEVYTRDGKYVTLAEWRESERPEHFALLPSFLADYCEMTRWGLHMQPWKPGKYRKGPARYRKVPAAWDADEGGVHAYGFPKHSENSGEARAMRELFAPHIDVDETGLIWLAPARIDQNGAMSGTAASIARSERAVVVDFSALDPDRLRDTGQCEGNVVHAGPIPAHALSSLSDVFPQHSR